MTEGECICSNLYLNSMRDEPVGKTINDDCPVHGIGTYYYNQQTAYWAQRLRELREEKKRRG